MRRGFCALAATALLPLAAFAQDFVVQGNCRDGRPHGAYELRSATGTLRVVGAFAQGRRTGSFLFWSSDGARVAHLPFEDDRLTGTLALWYPPTPRQADGRHRVEATYAAGRLSGLKRSWYPSGRPRAEYSYRSGELVEATAFTETGDKVPAAQSAQMAARDAAADDALVGSLEAMVRSHPPPCDAGADRKEKVPARGA